METAGRRRSVTVWESLLDLSYNIYPARRHLPSFFILIMKSDDELPLVG